MKIKLILIFLFASTQVNYGNDVTKMIQESKATLHSEGYNNPVTKVTSMSPKEYTSKQYDTGMSADAVNKAVNSPEEKKIDLAVNNQNSIGLLGVDWNQVMNKVSFNFILGSILSSLIIVMFVFLYYNKNKKQYLLSLINSLLHKVKVKIEKYKVNSTEGKHSGNNPNSPYTTLNNPNFSKSILIGVITAILIGFLFSNSTYFYNNAEYSFDYYKNSGNQDAFVIKEVFNYKLAFISSALVVAFMVFVYYDEKIKQHLLNRIINTLDKIRIGKVKVNTEADNSSLNISSNSNESLNSFKGYKNEIINIVKNDFIGGFINFNGRLPRKMYFLYMSLINTFFYILFYADNADVNVLRLFVIVGLYFLTKIYVLRLHDMNYSGWNSLFCLIPLFLILGFKASLQDFSGDIMDTIYFVTWIFIILFHILLLFKPGTKGINLYGPN